MPNSSWVLLTVLQTLTTIEAAQPLIDAGLRSTGATFFEGDDARFEIDISQGLAGKTEFPFVLVLAQQDTERIFERKLNEANVSVFRGKAVSSFEATDRGVRVHFQTGEVIETKYLVGADGTGSTVSSVDFDILVVCSSTGRYEHRLASSIPIPTILVTDRQTRRPSCLFWEMFISRIHCR